MTRACRSFTLFTSPQWGEVDASASEPSGEGGRCYIECGAPSPESRNRAIRPLPNGER
jgi:hypothetical protein